MATNVGEVTAPLKISQSEDYKDNYYYFFFIFFFLGEQVTSAHFLQNQPCWTSQGWLTQLIHKRDRSQQTLLTGKHETKQSNAIEWRSHKRRKKSPEKAKLGPTWNGQYHRVQLEAAHFSVSDKTREINNMLW